LKEVKVTSMRLGYFTMPLHPPTSDPAQTLADDLEQIVTLDRLGYVEAWIGEHFTSIWENIPCPDLFIASALARTEQIILGTGVSCLPNHHPVMLAERIAQLDQMARGRFYWGIGAGSLADDFALFDVDSERQEHRQLAREIVDTILALWDGPRPGLYEHRRWRFRLPQPRDENGPKLHLQPYQRPHPPIAVAGLSTRSDMLTFAGERGWIPMSINLVPTPTLVAHWQTYAASAQEAGRSPDRGSWRIARDVYVGETPAEARREALDGVLGRDSRDYFLPGLRRAKMLSLFKADPAMPDDDITLDYLLDKIWVVGDVDEVVDKLHQLYDDVGGFGTLLVMGHEWTPRTKWLQSMTLMAEEVVPRLRTLVA
jgi:alkanesulfonate monooxygenase SsuD/methylene tetrahydromethanopterin reductase-like flavin-dependent oxidoreductase (luciferase family)